MIDASPEESKPKHKLLKGTIATGLSVVALSAIFGDPYLDALGDGPHNDKNAERAAADAYYEKHFGDYAPRDQFQMQYVTGQEITTPAKLVGAKGILKFTGYVDFQREQPVSFKLGGTCLAGTPYDTNEGAVITSTFDYDTNPNLSPDGNKAYTVYPANNSNAPELHFVYSHYGVPGALLPVEDSLLPSYNKDILSAYGCPDVNVVPPTPKG